MFALGSRLVALTALSLLVVASASEGGKVYTRVLRRDKMSPAYKRGQVFTALRKVRTPGGGAGDGEDPENRGPRFFTRVTRSRDEPVARSDERRREDSELGIVLGHLHDELCANLANWIVFRRTSEAVRTRVDNDESFSYWDTLARIACGFGDDGRPDSMAAVMAAEDN